MVGFLYGVFLFLDHLRYPLSNLSGTHTAPLSRFYLIGFLNPSLAFCHRAKQHSGGVFSHDTRSDTPVLLQRLPAHAHPSQRLGQT